MVTMLRKQELNPKRTRAPMVLGQAFIGKLTFLRSRWLFLGSQKNRPTQVAITQELNRMARLV